MALYHQGQRSNPDGATVQESLIGLVDVVSLVLTRLDYCNAVLAGLIAYSLLLKHVVVLILVI